MALSATNVLLKMCDRDHPTEIDDSPLTRQTLLSRLKDWGDQESWQEFFDTYWKLIYRTARKAGPPDVEAQEVVQVTMISVARAIPEFKHDRALGSFKHWLLQLTGWRINDQMRKRRPEERMPRRTLDDTARTSTEDRVPLSLRLQHARLELDRGRHDQATR